MASRRDAGHRRAEASSSVTAREPKGFCMTSEFLTCEIESFQNPPRHTHRSDALLAPRCAMRGAQPSVRDADKQARRRSRHRRGSCRRRGRWLPPGDPKQALQVHALCGETNPYPGTVLPVWTRMRMSGGSQSWPNWVPSSSTLPSRFLLKTNVCCLKHLSLAAANLCASSKSWAEYPRSARRAGTFPPLSAISRCACVQLSGS